MKPLALVLIVALFVLSSVALLAPASTTAQEAGTIRIGLDVDAGTADPRLARDTSARRLIDIVFDGLVYLDAELNPQPALAESWQNPDPTTWVFTLRQGVTFHDGEALTAEDVVFTFETILDETLAAPYRALYTPIQSITAVDAGTVEFKLSQP
jgi:peptide/nickel transport system substrate-binding protein